MSIDKLYEILKELHSDVDFARHNSLIDEGVLDSFDIVTLVAEINDAYDVTVPPEEIIPENFNSAKALFNMIIRLAE